MDSLSSTEPLRPKPVAQVCRRDASWFNADYTPKAPRTMSPTRPDSRSSVETREIGAICIILGCVTALDRSEEHTSELQSLMRISYAVFCLNKQKKEKTSTKTTK